MASLQHKNVKSNKTNAIKSFYTNFEYIFHFFYVFATLYLFWHSSFFSIVLRSFSHLYPLSISLFSNSFFAFLLLNAIILFLFILSNQNSDVSSDTYNQCLKITASPELVTGDANSQYYKLTASELVTNPVISSPELVTDLVVFPREKQQDSVEETVRAVTETTTTTCCTTVTKNGENKVSEEKCYRRVQSECYERRIAVADQRRDLKRFNTCLKEKEPERKVCYVEELSKEEFNRTVEDFIAKHKRMQREEQLRSEEKLRSQKTEYLALAL
ncbi:hypothetical protein TSUD_312840 [Trifolium subterraneum]|uniref:DUF4408 domain-containing protein n=1 Tax=Trifolium subterraneum TaxID=3900 RepID=A0A2Z6MYI6_TRISU|nr:hypothetical protein TSUD_312840 [Trifolium subterraneum]